MRIVITKPFGIFKTFLPTVQKRCGYIKPRKDFLEARQSVDTCNECEPFFSLLAPPFFLISLFFQKVPSLYCCLVKMRGGQSGCLPACLPACLPVFQPDRLASHLLIQPSLSRECDPDARLTVCPSVCLSVCADVFFQGDIFHPYKAKPNVT